MMISDDAVIVLSDERAFLPFGKDSDGNLKFVSCYVVMQTIGEGRFGEVQLGVHETSGERFALKFVSKSAINSILDSQQVSFEYKILSSLNHRNIMKVITVSNLSTVNNYRSSVMVLHVLCHTSHHTVAVDPRVPQDSSHHG